MSEPTRYIIRTVSDFVALPAEKLGACLIDFAAWLEVVQSVHLLSKTLHITTPLDEFGWVDDGKHEMTLAVNDPTGKELARSVTEFAPPE